MIAIHKKDVDLVKEMIQTWPLGALQTIYTSITYPSITIDLVSPLHLVAASSKDEVFDILLENNFPPFSNSLGETPLHIAACRRDNYKITRLVNKYPQLLGIFFIYFFIFYFYFFFYFIYLFIFFFFELFLNFFLFFIFF